MIILDESCSSVPTPKVACEGMWWRDHLHLRRRGRKEAQEEVGAQRRQLISDGEWLEHDGVAIGDRGKEKKSPRETQREMCSGVRTT